MPLPFRYLFLTWVAIAPAWGEPGSQQVGGASAASQLAASLDDADPSVAGEAAKSLGQSGASAFPAIRGILATGSAQQRWGATVALYQSTADPEPFLPELTRQLADQGFRSAR